MTATDPKALLLDALRAGDAKRSRSTQVQIGPSELGGCRRKVWYHIRMTKFIDENQFYWITDVTHLCCDEVQFKYVCRVCSETMDCSYCGFDPYGPHGCDTL